MRIDGVKFPDNVSATGGTCGVTIRASGSSEDIRQLQLCWELYADRWHPAGYGTKCRIEIDASGATLTMWRNSSCD